MAVVVSMAHRVMDAGEGSLGEGAPGRGEVDVMGPPMLVTYRLQVRWQQPVMCILFVCTSTCIRTTSFCDVLVQHLFCGLLMRLLLCAIVYLKREVCLSQATWQPSALSQCLVRLHVLCCDSEQASFTWAT